VIKLFKRNDIVPFIAIIFIALIIKWNALIHPPSIIDIDSFNRGFVFQWKWIFNFYTSSPHLSVGLALLLQIVFAFYFNLVMNSERLFARKSFIPALSFIIITSWLPFFTLFSTAFIANFFIFAAFAQTLKLYNLPHARRACFDIGCLLGIAILFYFPAISCILLCFLLILLLRPFVLQETIAFLSGIICVVYLTAGIIFVFGNLKSAISHSFYHFALPLKIALPAASLTASIVSITLLVYGAFLINQTGEQNSMAVRKKWNAVFFYCIFGLILGIFSPIFPSYTWIFALTPFSILLSQAFQHKNEKFNNFTLYFLMLALLIVQWMLI
jgi:hypothetical protein